MVLMFILLGLIVVVPILYAVSEDYHFWDDYGIAFMVCLCIFGGIFAITNVIGGIVHTSTHNTQYTQKIVSINDGTGIKGSISGGLFIIRGGIGDTQHFSYYRDADNGSFSLEKRDATQSSIFPDATPETATVTITDSITTCTGSWWSVLCFKVPNTFVHADFHVPAGSIKNEYSLDAQ